tara:strand:+ start:2987 stop:3229 length:243 start_codon:yes stop_codon:yes gene_type:complete
MTKPSNRSPVSIFIAASALIATGAIQPDFAKAEDMGGLKEWDTDQSVDADSKLDKEAKKALKKAKEEDICIPVGEGENCW